MRLLMLAACLCASAAFAQTDLGITVRTENSTASAGAPSGASSAPAGSHQTPNAAQIAQLHADNQQMRFDLIASVTKLNNLEGSISKSSERAEAASIRSSWFAFLTVAFSIAFGLVGQYFLIRHQRSLNKDQEKAKVSNAYVEWQLKQLSELYGPLRTLLGQSIAIYRQMNRVLIAADDKKFRLEPKPGADVDDAEFQIFLGGKWERFRTVEHLPLVYNKGYSIEPYFDDVVNAGEAIAGMIRQGAGYVRPEDKELIKVMGIYLAHYGVLCRLHKRAVEGEEVNPTAADIKASFPHVIHGLVDAGLDAINTQIMDWRNFRPAQTS